MYFLTTSLSVKEMIEQVGIPSEEVDLILANGISVDFSYKVKDGDRVSVYPIFETFDISGITRVREKPLKEKKKREVLSDGTVLSGDERESVDS